MTYIPPINAFLIAALVIIIILRSKFGNAVQDVPNERSLHSKPVPRTGGIALMAGVLSSWAVMWPLVVWWIVIPTVLLFAVSFLDDLHNLSVKQRLLAHMIAAAALVIGANIFGQQGFWIAIIVMLAVVWMINLFNFMDGSDGLAGGMALFGFANYGIAALLAHDESFAMMNLAISAAALGFLLFNSSPAKIFMGDAGSIPLGFLAAAMGLWGWQRGDWSPLFPVLVFLPFIADATVTLVKRTLQGLKITEAHRDHYYQRAIQSGMSHRRVAHFEYMLMAAIGVTAQIGLQQGMLPACFLLWSAFCLSAMVWLDMKWRKVKG
jgi:UDP-N-acetylmuramyl pentapeptide phosphotransferase/UDP-N-acetylglucosamine-1-phosphate transferase